MKKNKVYWQEVFSRILIAIVTFLNLQAAFQFMFAPEKYSPGFEVVGTPGDALIQGMGLLFLMWNIPYIVAIIDPDKHFTSLIEALIMQAIGVVGETALLFSLKGEHALIHESVIRFIIFDGGGLVFLIAAFLIMLKFRRSKIS